MPRSQFSHDAPIPNQITLVDEETGRSLNCSIEHSFVEKGNTYYLLLPLNCPVAIIAWDSPDEDSGATWLEDSAEIAQIYPNAKAVLEEQELTLHHEAYTLTVSGDVPEPEESDVLTIEIETDGDELESEEFQWLAKFYHNSQEYEIYTPLDPLLFFAKQQHNKVELLSIEELESIQPYIQTLLIDELDREE